MRTVKTLKPTLELVVQCWSRERKAECLGSRTPGARAGDVAIGRVALRIDWWERGRSAAGPPEAGGTQ